MKKILAIAGLLLGIGLIGKGMWPMARMVLGMTEKAASAISIIGGADGPTSIFIAGKVGNGFSITCTVSGVILILISAISLRNMKKQK